MVLDPPPGLRVPWRSSPGDPPRLGTVHALAWALVGGLLVASAFEPLAFSAGVIGGPACLVLALQGQRFRVAVLIGFVFGLAFQGVLLVWLSASIGPAAWLALSLVQALWFGVLGGLVCLWRRLPGPSLWFALGWVAVEEARSMWPFGGLPWGRLGFAVVDTPYAGLLPYLGIPVVGLVIAFSAAVLAALLRPGSERRRTSGAALVATLGVGLLPVVAPLSPVIAASMTVAVVQGGVPGDGTRLVDHHREVTENHVEATIDLARRVEAGVEPRPDLVVWPENSTAVDPVTDPVARAGIDAAVRAVDAPVLVGGMVDGPTPRSVLNQGIVWTTDGPTASRYTKHHPVPFGEYIPFRGLLGKLSPRLDEVPRDMLPGTSTSPLEAGGVRVADAICFDIAYDDVLAPQIRRGAQLIVVQTSNASFTGTSQVEQQFAITRARALETGRAIAVASTNGVTAIIAPDGTVTERAPLLTTSVLVADVPLSDTLTPAVRWGSRAGDVLLVIAGGALFAALGGLLRTRVRTRAGAAGSGSGARG